jgi:hypothetical protein
VFLIAVLDDLVRHVAGRPASYLAAEAARRAQADFSDRP